MQEVDEERSEEGLVAGSLDFSDGEKSRYVHYWKEYRIVKDIKLHHYGTLIEEEKIGQFTRKFQ